MTAEFASDCHPRALNRCTSIPISHLPRLLLYSRRITASPILRAFGITSPTFAQCLAAIVWMNRTIQAKTRRAFSTSCRLSYWSNSFGAQSTFTATITSRRNDFVFGLGFCIDCRHWVWTPRIAVVATQAYPTKMLLQLRNLHVP